MICGLVVRCAMVKGLVVRRALCNGLWPRRCVVRSALRVVGPWLSRKRGEAALLPDSRKQSW
jgi:hypothetical protein